MLNYSPRLLFPPVSKGFNVNHGRRDKKLLISVITVLNSCHSLAKVFATPGNKKTAELGRLGEDTNANYASFH